MTARQSTSVRGRPQTHPTCLRAGATGEQLANESEPKTHKFKGFGEPQANAGAVTVQFIRRMLNTSCGMRLWGTNPSATIAASFASSAII
jgi:hypothetical protein